MIKTFFTSKYYKEHLLLVLCLAIILCAAVLIWYSQETFRDSIVNSFYEEQTNHTFLASNLLKDHIEESEKNLAYIVNLIGESVNYASKKKVLDDFFKIYPDQFISLSLLDRNGDVEATSGAAIVNRNFFEYVLVEKKEETTKSLTPFISERIIRAKGYPSTFMFVPFLMPGEDSSIHYMVGELSLKGFVSDKMGYIKDKAIVFVMTDNEGEIYGIINLKHEAISRMENGNLFKLTNECLGCHKEDSFFAFKEATLDKASHSQFEAPSGELFYRTVARVNILNEDWLVSISQPHSRIQGQIAKNFRANALLIILLVIGSILGAYGFYRIRRKEAVEEQYSDLVNRLDVGIVRLKESGEITHMNQAMHTLLGVEHKKMPGRLAITEFLIDDTEWQNIVALLNEFDSTAEYDSWIRTKRGTECIVAFSMNAHKNNYEEIIYIDGVIQDITDKKQAEAELHETNYRLERLSNTDGLTGLANRRFFDEVLLTEYSRHLRSGKKLALILLDIDCFKAYNDFYGHIAGDECLQEVARVLDACTHRPSDLAARFGGEEFVCILPETDLEGALAVAEKIRTGIAALAIPHRASHVTDRVTVSCGVVSQLCIQDGSAKGILELADSLLYRAKELGRDRVESPT